MPFAETQKQLADHLRNPQYNSAPEGVEDRRLQIYRDLVFNNIEGFISSGFPILRSLYEEQDWLELVRDFIVTHRADSPYFLEISAEFVQYLNEEREMRSTDPGFMQELAHYEWVELALDVSEEQLPPANLADDLLLQTLQVSPLAWALSYQYPVHLLGPDYRPDHPAEEPTFLIVYRNRQDQVEFMASNAVTVRLLNILSGADNLSGRGALLQLAEEIAHPDPQQLLVVGHDLLKMLQSHSIIL